MQATVTSAIQSAVTVGADPHVWEFRTAVVAGSGSFGDTGQQLGDLGARDVVIGDLDGDGDLDAVAVSWNGPNEVWLNDGAGNFTDSGQSPGGDRTYGVALGDVDGDGDLDAYFAMGEGGYYNTVWLNDGLGNLTDSGQTLGNSKSVDVSLADLDGDGDLDAFVVNRWNNGNSRANKVWLNNGQGSFTDSGQSIGTSESRDLALGDLDGDGDLDAFVANSYLHSSDPVPVANKVWLNQGGVQGGTPGTFADSGQNLGDDVLSERVALGDLDGDGDLDAFVANGGYKSSTVPDDVWLNDGQGVFGNRQLVGDSRARGLALGDLDADGDLDALVTNGGSGTYGGTPWFNDGGTFSDSGQRLGEGVTSGVDLGDFDGDGDLDAFMGQTFCYDDCSNTVWLNLDPGEAPALLAADGFESGSFLGGSEQWSSGQWSAAGDAAISTNSPLGSFEARLRRSTGDLIRSVDASGLSDLTLTFASRLNSFESIDKAWVKTSPDGVNWTTVMEFGDGEDDNQYHQHQIDITDPSDTLYVRFDAGMSNHKDYWYIDDIFVTGVPDGPLSLPPEITSTPTVVATEDVLYTYDVEASDPDAGDTLTFSLTSAPGGMSIVGETGLMSWTPTNSHVGTNPVTVRVQDQSGAFATQSFDISVTNVNDAPTIDSSAVTTATVDAAYTYDVEASDPDAGDALTYSLGVAPVGMTIDSTTGLIQWTPSSAHVGTHPVTVVVEDTALASDTEGFVIVVSDAPNEITYVKDEVPDLPIPDQGAETSTLTVGDSFAIANLTLSVNISHQRPSDLKVFLTHGSTTVQLSDISGGNLSAFNGDDVNGDWILEVRDTKKKKTGVLKDWEITVESALPAASVAELVSPDLTRASLTDELSFSGENDSSSSNNNPTLLISSDLNNAAFGTAADAAMASSVSITSDEDEQLNPSLEDAIEELISEV